MNKEVVVVGGGLAGLTAASFLARAGLKVTLFEKSRSLGGRAMTETRSGFHFNLGPHALYKAGHAAKILHELGVNFSGGLPGTSGRYAIYRGEKHTLPSGLASLMTTGLFGLADKMEAGQFLATMDKINGQAAQRLTVREWLDQNVRHEEVRQLIEAFFRVSTYAHDPERMSAGAALDQFQLAVSANVLYLDGGWQTLVDGLRIVAENSCVNIIRSAKVEVIERDPDPNGRVRGIRLADGKHYEASSVIVAAAPSDAAALVERGDASPLGAWAKSAIPVKAACLEVGLRRLPQPHANFALGIDRPLYFSVHTAGARLAPTDGAVIHAAKYLGAEPQEDPHSVRRELEQLMDLVQPGWRAELVESAYLPKMTVAHALVTATQGGMAGRPGPEVPGVAGLYIAGDWVGGVGMLADASVASGKRAAELVARSVGLAVTAAA